MNKPTAFYKKYPDDLLKSSGYFLFVQLYSNIEVSDTIPPRRELNSSIKAEDMTHDSYSYILSSYTPHFISRCFSMPVPVPRREGCGQLFFPLGQPKYFEVHSECGITERRHYSNIANRLR